MSSLQRALLASTERSTSPTTCHMTEMALVARTQMQGRGYVDANTLFSGSGAGRWFRDGHLVRMSGVVSISGWITKP